MPRLSNTKWAEARADFEAGASARATAEKFGVSHAAVNKRVVSEGWTQDYEEVIRRKVAAKVSGIVSSETIEKRAVAIDAEADRRVKVAERHIKLVEQATALQQQAIGAQMDGKFAPDFDTQKSAKINSETVAILITLERKIHKLEDADPQTAPVKIVFARYADDGD